MENSVCLKCELHREETIKLIVLDSEATQKLICNLCPKENIKQEKLWPFEKGLQSIANRIQKYSQDQKKLQNEMFFNKEDLKKDLENNKIHFEGVRKHVIAQKELIK
jgi:hypothetical protein